MAELDVTPPGSGDDHDWLGTAISLARDNVEAGGRPFGAVVVLDGVLAATGVNDVARSKDPTAHAELSAIREACAVLGRDRLTGAVLYTSCEPCPMCLAAAFWAGLTEIVYGADSGAAARAGFEDEELYDLFDRPRAAWPIAVRHQEHALADGPLNEWTRSQQADRP